MTPEQLLAIDRAHAWHPYAPMPNPVPCYPVAAARGVELELADGRRLIDGMASWWSVIHGYNHPVLNRALQDQLGRMAHVMYGGLTHEAAVRLVQTLVEITPEPLRRVFLADSGSVSVEVAIKMALQYQLGRGRPRRQRLLTVRGGYHGDTFHAMSVCDPVTGMHRLFSGLLPEQLFAERPGCRFGTPWDEGYIADFERQLERHQDRIAAVILEPVVQGAGGMWFYAPEYLQRVRALCDRHDVLLICDEIATGFGRSGRLFACEHAGIAPDIMCLGKALTGGYMTLAAALCSERVAAGIGQCEAGVLMHGPTFMANPLACAVANASIGVLLDQDWQARVARIERLLGEGLAPAAGLPGVTEVRVLGAIGVIELEQPLRMAEIQPRFVEAGIWVRPFGRLVYTMPPYVIEDDQLDRLTAGMCRVVADYLAAA
jgi:adenosylmethionine-8-amino-7-oxononanoate aminotransferase